MSASNGSNRIHLLGQQNPKNGKHNATLDEVHEIVVGVLGPLAQLLREVCIRQQAIEDHVGYKAPLPETTSGYAVVEPPVGDTDDRSLDEVRRDREAEDQAHGGDIEC